MSNTPSPSANNAAFALLRLGLALIATLALMFLLVHFGNALPFGKAFLYAAGILGSGLILAALLALFRELTPPLQSYEHKRPLNH